jgi:D-cysteine desulfhydrase
MSLEQLPRFPLAHLPTPLEPLPRLSQALGGPELFIKRDDQTGLAFGGNKARKLEFLLAEALAQKADTLITAGAAQSNHCRQTAAAAAQAGLRCELLLGGPPPALPNGNFLLDLLFGATIHWAGPERRGERLEELAAQLKAAGHRPYVIPYGGSNAVGASGYVWAMQELLAQLKASGQTIDHIVLASSSGGTQAGLTVGARAANFTGRIIGIRIDKGEQDDAPYEAQLAQLATETARKTDLPKTTFTSDDFTVNYDYLGGGYGVVGDLEREALRLTAQLEGILLDPVYTGRAMGGLLDLIRRGTFGPGERVLFWHTGGGPALFPYGDVLTTPQDEDQLYAALQAYQDQLEEMVTARTVELQQANQQLRTLNEQWRQQVALARKVQEGLLPKGWPDWPGLDVAGYSAPAQGVGGDFYLCHALEGEGFAVAVGDISGKGLQAALMMSLCVASLKSVAAHAARPGMVLTELDDTLTPFTMPTGQNCALCYTEVKGSTLRVANAGCMIPIIRRANGDIEWVEAYGLPLGMELKFEYTDSTITLEPGDFIILTSDGVTEATNKTKEFFGFDRLEEAVINGPQVGAEAMLTHLKAKISAFLDGIKPHDDLTIVVLQVVP